MSDLAAPTAKWAASDMTAATMIAGRPAIKKKGSTGMKAPTAVESAPETAETHGLLRPSSLMWRRSRGESVDELLFSSRRCDRRSGRRLPRAGP